MLINSTFCNSMAYDLLNWLNFDFSELYRTLCGQKTHDEARSTELQLLKCSNAEYKFK